MWQYICVSWKHLISCEKVAAKFHTVFEFSLCLFLNYPFLSVSAFQTQALPAASAKRKRRTRRKWMALWPGDPGGSDQWTTGENVWILLGVFKIHLWVLFGEDIEFHSTWNGRQIRDLGSQMIFGDGDVLLAKVSGGFWLQGSCLFYGRGQSCILFEVIRPWRRYLLRTSHSAFKPLVLGALERSNQMMQNRQSKLWISVSLEESSPRTPTYLHPDLYQTRQETPKRHGPLCWAQRTATAPGTAGKTGGGRAILRCVIRLDDGMMVFVMTIKWLLND